jgi:hypothetical protein
VGLVLVVTSEKESLSLLSMAVEVDDHLDGFFLGKLKYLIFYIIDFGIKVLDGLVPPPI